MAPSASGRRESGRERERERDRSPAASEHHHRDHGRSSSHKTSERSRSPSRSSMDRSSERQYRRSSSRDRRSERRLSERSRSPVIRDRKEVHRSRSPRSPRSDRRSPSRRSPRRSASYEGRRDSYRSRSRSRSRERRDYSKRKEVDDDKERKRKGDERKEREESHGRGERKDSDRERDRDKEVENISAGFIEKPADGYMEEDGEIREFQTEDEVQIKANSDALAAGLLDAKKSEPLSLEEILKKRKEDALQQAKPVFLTKAQRQELALKRRQEESVEQLKRNEEQRKLLMGTESKGKEQEDKDRQREKERDRDRDYEREAREARERERDRERRERDREREEEAKNRERERLEKQMMREHEKELEAIKEQLKDGVEEGPEEAAAQKQKEEAANNYDTFEMCVDRHWSEKKIEEMTERDWGIFREDFNISYKGSHIPRPMRNWEESALSPELLKAVQKVGYKKPSPIQMAAIPIGLQQRDVIGIAETGSGKTAAFVLPMLTYISKLPPMTEEIEAEGPYAVVMAPTRELAQQIEDETVKFAHFLDIRVVSIVGGQSTEEQGFKLRQGCEIVIATPGHLLDCLERRYAVLNQCNYVVLDEVDRMIDMGFEPQVMGVLDAMPSSNLKPENEDAELDKKKIYRTTYMFSATMPPAVERLARKYLRNPVVVTIGTAGTATDLITQHVIRVNETEKLDRLCRVLNEMGDKTAIIFVNTKKNADSLSRQLDKAGYHVTTLHGGKTQEQREISLEGFRNKRFNCLVATDVAGRGIDIPDVAHVINYDMPGSIEMYTHRIGHTVRAGKNGVATTFLTLFD